MIATRFRSVGWVAAVATAALGCYLVSLRVASERNKVEALDSAILDTRRNIQDLRIEIATRGGLNQIEKWNVNVLALSAPKAGQFLKGEMQLASLVAPRAPVTERAGEPKDQTPVGTKVIPVDYEAPSSADQPVLRPATYIRPAGDRVVERVQKVALLDDNVLGELRHAATTEKTGSRKAQQ